MQPEIKLCKDCKHYKQGNPSMMFSHAKDDFSSCLKFGEDYTHPRYARKEEDFCGENGKFWEAKDFIKNLNSIGDSRFYPEIK
jgi:hypothetical protein